MKKASTIIVILFVCMVIIACGQQLLRQRQTNIYKDNSDETKKWETIEISGLSKEYKFLYITDAHLILLDGTENENVKEYAMERMAGFAHDNALPIEEQFEMWLSEAEKEQVDTVLLGGDTIDFPSDANINYLDEHLSALKIPYMYTPGNHDWTYPWEYMTEYARNNYLPLLSPYMQSDPAVSQMDFGEFIIVSVDNSTNQIAPEALEMYKEILQKGKPVIVMLHVPLLTQSVLTKAKEARDSGVVLGGGNYGGIYPNEISSEFIALTTAETSPVVAVLAGHVHFYDRDMINENIVQIVGDAGYKGGAMWISVKARDN